MKTIHFCSTNNGKKLKLQKDISLFSNQILLEIVDLEIIEIQDINCENIAKHKVMEVFKKINKPCVAMDSGLYIESLNNFPGSYVKMILDTIGIQGIGELLKNRSNRKFEIRNCLAYYDGAHLKIFSEKIEGLISSKIYGKINNDYAWSELCKIIIPDGFSITLAEMGNDTYLEWDSVRNTHGMVEQLVYWLEENNHFMI